jgi:hypothetical protein
MVMVLMVGLFATGGGGTPFQKICQAPTSKPASQHRGIIAAIDAVTDAVTDAVDRIRRAAQDLLKNLAARKLRSS